MRLRHLAPALLALPALLLGACSGDEPESKGSTTSTTSALEQTTTTLSDDDYEAATESGTKAVEEAEGDLCAIIQASSSFAVPTTSAQVESTVGLIRTTYGAIADAMRADDAASADALVNGAEAIVAEAEAAGFPADFFTTPQGPKAMSDPAFQAGLQAIQATYAKECETPSLEGGDVPVEGGADAAQAGE